GLIFIMKSAAVAVVSVPFAMGIFFLEFFVSFVQAFIFTMLSALFIGMGVQTHEHDDVDPEGTGHAAAHCASTPVGTRRCERSPEVVHRAIRGLPRRPERVRSSQQTPIPEPGSGDSPPHRRTLEGSLTMTNIALAYLAAGLGAGLAVFGAALGIGRLASAALEATGRQPSAAGDIRTSMIIPAAFIEGVGLFGVVVCLLLALK